MIEITSRPVGSAQPIRLAAGALVVIVLGVGGITVWRAYSGPSPEPDRVIAARQLQARTAQASEQLVEKTKGLEVTQQESIDQLQVVQDQLQIVKRQLTAQQADTKRLSEQVSGLTEQVSGLTEAVGGLKQSFASAQGPDANAAPSPRNNSVRSRSQAAKRAHRSHTRTRG